MNIFFSLVIIRLMSKKSFSFIFKQSLPVLFGYLALGIAFGLVVVQSGYPWWLATVSGIFMYAGAGQFIAIGLFSAGASLTAVLISELLVNIRHIVYGLSLITQYKGVGKWKPYLIFGLTDETYSILTTVECPPDIEKKTFYGFLTLFDQIYWVTGSTIGALAGSLIPFDLTGVDFALTALFAVLLTEQIISSKNYLSSITGMVATLCTVLLWRFGIIKDANNIIILSLCVGLAFIFITKRKDFKSDKNNEPVVQNELQEEE